MPSSVIPTKLYAPSPRAGVVVRERLSLRFQKALQRRLTLALLVAGQQGSGRRRYERHSAFFYA
jgi:ATP/maltotriose-dependent transcriptional regulator MalT